MSDFSTLYLSNHRNQRYMLLGCAALAIVCGLAPRNERALFVLGDRPAPKAFAAFAPPAFNGFFGNGGQGGARSYRFRVPGLPQGRGAQIPNGLEPAGPAGAVPGEAGVPNVGGSPFQLATLDPGGPGIPGAPLAGSAPQTFGAAAPPSNAGGGPTNPTGPGTPTSPGTPTGPGSPAGPGTPTAPITPIPALPEPATWAMLVFGFFGMGAILRRRVRLISLARGDCLRI